NQAPAVRRLFVASGTALDPHRARLAVGSPFLLSFLIGGRSLLISTVFISLRTLPGRSMGRICTAMSQRSLKFAQSSNRSNLRLRTARGRRRAQPAFDR